MKYLVKAKLVAFAAVMLIGTAAYGDFAWTSSPTPATVPSNAFINTGDNEVHYYFQRVTYTAVAGVSASANIIISMPADASIQVAAPNGGVYTDGISLITSSVLGVVSVGGATATSITVSVAAVNPILVGETVTIIFPVVTDSSLSTTGPKTAYTFSTSDNLLDGAGAQTTADSATFAADIKPVSGFTFDGTYLADDGSGQTTTDDLGEYLPGENTLAFTAALPDWVVDNGTSEVSAADPWTGYTAALDGVNNGGVTGEITFKVWASQTAGLEYVDNGVATALFRHAAGTEVLGDNFEEAAAMTDAMRTAGLTEGNWYIYLSSSSTADWALAQSDTLVVKHYPSFVDPVAATPAWQLDNTGDAANGGGAGQGIDYNHDAALANTDGAADDAGTLTLDTGNIVGYDGTTGVTAYDYVDIYWHGNDVDNPAATVQVYLSDDPSLDIGDVTTLAGLVTGLTGATEITASPMLLDDPVNYIRYTVSQSPPQTVDDYYFYLVAWDGTNKVVQLITDTVVGAANPVALVTTIKHSPTFEFQDIYAVEGAAAPAGQVPLNTQTTADIKVSWGETVMSARDLDASSSDPLIIKLYSVVSNQDNGGTVDGEHGTLVGDPLSDAGLLAYGGTVLLETITDTLDGQLDNAYMWDIRSVSPALSVWTVGAGTEWEYFIYAVASQGGDKVVVQYTSDGTYLPGGAADDRGFQFTHSAFLQSKTPVPNSSVELLERDNYRLEWDAFDYTGASYVQAFIAPTADAVDYSATAHNAAAIATGGNAGVYWLPIVGANAAGEDNPGGGAAVGWLASAGGVTIDVSAYTTDLTPTVDNPSEYAINTLLQAGAIGTEYDVWYFINEAGVVFDAQTPTKAAGTIFFSIEDPGTAQNVRITPNKSITAVIGDIITYTVGVNVGAATPTLTAITLAIDVPNTSMSVVDGGSGPFTATHGTINVVALNNRTAGASNDELDLGISGAATAFATWASVATFQVQITANPAGVAPIVSNVVFRDDGAARVTKLFDSNTLPILTTYDAAALAISLVRPARITGSVEVEGRTSDKAQDVSFLLVPRGSMQPNSNTGYLAANDDDADATNGVGVTLSSDGVYTLSSVPTGNYDLILRKPGYLDQMASNISVTPLVDLTVNFLDGDKLFGGDAAGYDHDNSSGTLDLGDNQIDATDDAPAFAAAMTATSDSSFWNALADITGDSLIWADDWAIMVKNQSRTSEGTTYKAMPASGSGNLIASLDLISEAGDEKTYAVSMLQARSLRGYAVELGINPSDWKLVSYEDGLASHYPALDMHKSLGYDELFISATKGFNPINSDEIEILTVTVRSLTSDPEAISISSAEIVGLDGKMSKAVIAASAGLPEEFTLSQNYPNPFNPVTTINFALPAPGNVKLAVYNLLGQEVQTLVSGTMEPGVYIAMWNSMDNVGRKVSSGVYFYRLVVDGKIMSTKKMLMLK